MERSPKLRVALFFALTALFALSLGLMFLLWAAFQPVWFFTSLALYAGLAILTLAMIGRGVTHEYGIPERPDVGLLVEMPTRPGRDYDLPAEPLEEPPPASAVPQAMGYAMRGYTLYERRSAKGPVRFFAKKQPPASAPAELPSGFEARWDGKKRRPILVPLRPVMEPAPRMDVVPERASAAVATRRPGTGGTAAFAPPVTARLCAAMPRPGEFCRKAARPNSRYCGTHAGFRADAGGPKLDINVPRGGGATTVLRPHLGAVTVRVAKPTPMAKAKSARGKGISLTDFVVRPATSPAGARPKPLRLSARPEPRVVVPKGSLAPPPRHAPKVRPRAAPKPRTVQLVVRADTERREAKPLKVAQPRIEVVRDSKKRTLVGLAQALKPKGARRANA